jgi:bifunctional non-homologous end joining protein LigD
VKVDDDRLTTYRKKRRFDRTPEPAPERRVARKAKAHALEFVVQKHDATRLHYDVRIEIAGAMMSWAVPKGPSLDPKVKRLAVETEDHPMSYNKFEGRIPDGEYGAGDVLIWDRGTYETVPPGQEEAMRAKGHIHVRFAGDKLIGEWHFVRTAGRAGSSASKPSWLMFKAKDAYADPKVDLVAARPGSVVSGKSATRGPRRHGASRKGQTPKSLLAAVGLPMRATPTKELANPRDYSYEIKFDGYRLLAARAGDMVSLVTRKGNDWTGRFLAIDRAMKSLSAGEAVIDGEACILDAAGHTSFRRLQAWLGGETGAGTLAFIAFDLLWLDGRDLRGLKLEERRDLLRDLLDRATPPLVFSESLRGAPAEIEAAARASKLEGLIAKRMGSPYVSEGSGSWYKIVFRRQEEVAIAGYVPLVGTTNQVGALIIAMADEKGRFDIAGKVGTGFSEKMRLELARRLDRDASDVPTVQGHPRIEGARWAEIKLVAEIELREWTKDGAALAPSFIALREDKDPADCVRERREIAPKSDGRGSREHPRTRAKRSAAPKRDGTFAGSVALTNPDKVLFPRDGITKREIATYYDSVADSMLPYLAGRPLGLQRWPNGIDEEAWFQQKAPDKVPDFVRIVDAGPRHGESRKIVAENRETLLWLANLAALTLHQWASHVPSGVTAPSAVATALGHADYTVLDLDPGDGVWDHVIQVALAVRAALEKLGLESVVKTSGQRGIHVLIPFRSGPDHATATEFGKKLATGVADTLPDIATVERMKARRGGRLYIDALQNGEGKTIVAPYTLRAKDGAPVSTPIQWSEVTKSLDPGAFTIRTVLRRIAKFGDLLSPLLGSRQTLPTLK